LPISNGKENFIITANGWPSVMFCGPNSLFLPACINNLRKPVDIRSCRIMTPGVKLQPLRFGYIVVWQ